MLQAAVGEGQQRSVQGALGVLQDGIVLVDVLHYLWVELIFLQYKNKQNIYCHNNISRHSKKQNKKKLPYAFNIPAANLKANQ